jgi:AbrB family looped-hinge helix DNA binding protein
MFVSITHSSKVLMMLAIRCKRRYTVDMLRNKSMKCIRQIYGTGTVNEKGQIVIPADARRDLGIEPDMKFMIIGDPKRRILALVPAELVEKKLKGVIDV